VQCPRCSRKLTEIEERGVQIDFCAGCKGTWLDKDEVAAFGSDDVKSALLEESLFASSLIAPVKSPMSCPVCSGKMTEGGLFSGDYRIDRCDRCGGIWFDKRELSRLAELQAPRAAHQKAKASEEAPTPKAAPVARRPDAVDPQIRAILAELHRIGRAMRASREPHCPSCNRIPSIKDLWQCTCGWVWNVFRTGARCPACNHHWRETRCAGCGTWSQHALWYAG
jgi:Zn-finger nucleic acid-binding protein